MGETGGNALHLVYGRRAGVAIRKIADESLLVPTSGELAHLQRIFVLDAVGEFVWERLDGVRNLAKVADEVTEEFDVAPADAGADIDEFVQSLLEAGLVVESPDHDEG